MLPLYNILERVLRFSFSSLEVFFDQIRCSFRDCIYCGYWIASCSKREHACIHNPQVPSSVNNKSSVGYTTFIKRQHGTRRRRMPATEGGFLDVFLHILHVRKIGGSAGVPATIRPQKRGKGLGGDNGRDIRHVTREHLNVKGMSKVSRIDLDGVRGVRTADMDVTT